MKKLTAILVASVVIWGCSKKMSPNTTTSTGGNNGTVVNNAPAPMGDAKTNTNTNTLANTTPVENTGAMGSKVAPAPTAETAKLMQGQATHNAKCGRCHGLKVTTDYTAERWVSIMQVMATKARLDETEKANVLAYVQANSKK